MRRLTAIAVIATGILLATALPATAKGVDQATIIGPGISKPIVVGGGGGEPGSSGNLSWLATGTGLFDVMFGDNQTNQGPVRLTAEPTGSLGPRYVVSYRIPGLEPTGGNGFVRQDVYPYATAGLLIYTPAGQKSYDKTTVAGWARGKSDALALLNTLGVPKKSDTPPPPDYIAGPNPLAILLVIALVGVIGAALIVGRRRPRDA